MKSIEKKILEYYEGVSDYDFSIYVFFDRENLRRALQLSREYTVANFDGFWNGFQAPGLTFVVDTGKASQSADEKLKAVITAYLRAPNTRNMFLAATHDGGYGVFFDSEKIDVFRKRMILVEYRPMAYDVKDLNLPTIRFSDLFRDKELPRLPPLPAHDDEPTKELVLNADTNPEWRNRGKPLTPVVSTPTSAISQQMRWKPEKSQLLDRDPQAEKELWERPVGFPCLRELFELEPGAKCAPDDGCRMEQHNLPRNTPAELARIARLREYVRHTYPCDKGTQSQCKDMACIRAHVCPYGPCCSLREVGYCKFSEEMHRPLEENLEDLEYLLLRTLRGYRNDTNTYRLDEFYAMLQHVATSV